MERGEEREETQTRCYKNSMYKLAELHGER